MPVYFPAARIAAAPIAAAPITSDRMRDLMCAPTALILLLEPSSDCNERTKLHASFPNARAPLRWN